MGRLEGFSLEYPQHLNDANYVNEKLADFARDCQSDIPGVVGSPDILSVNLVRERFAAHSLLGQHVEVYWQHDAQLPPSEYLVAVDSAGRYEMVRYPEEIIGTLEGAYLADEDDDRTELGVLLHPVRPLQAATLDTSTACYQIPLRPDMAMFFAESNNPLEDDEVHFQRRLMYMLEVVEPTDMRNVASSMVIGLNADSLLINRSVRLLVNQGIRNVIYTDATTGPETVQPTALPLLRYVEGDLIGYEINVDDNRLKLDAHIVPYDSDEVIGVPLDTIVDGLFVDEQHEFADQPLICMWQKAIDDQLHLLIEDCNLALSSPEMSSEKRAMLHEGLKDSVTEMVDAINCAYLGLHNRSTILPPFAGVFRLSRNFVGRRIVIPKESADEDDIAVVDLDNFSYEELALSESTDVPGQILGFVLCADELDADDYVHDTDFVPHVALHLFEGNRFDYDRQNDDVHIVLIPLSGVISARLHESHAN